jgi:hypothetical protein
VAGRVAFSNPRKTWTEHYNLIELLVSVLKAQGHAARAEESWLVHSDSGFVLLPRLVNLQPLEKGGVRTTTTIQTNQPGLVPQGVFEYQHSTGDNIEESFRKGFEGWLQTDYVALLEALQPNPSNCTTLKMSFPEKDGRPAIWRRAVLGPVMHLVEHREVYAEPKTAEAGEGERGERCETHAFCPCCLLTKSYETFKELIEDSGFYGLRLFASRDQQGLPQADCRVNGDNWEKGAEALRKYVTTWPLAGLEFRKQYVVVHTIEKES